MTPTQRYALGYARKHGAGILVRYKGGLWSAPGEPAPVLKASTHTVNALIGQNLADVVDRDGKGRMTKVRVDPEWMPK